MKRERGDNAVGDCKRQRFSKGGAMTNQMRKRGKQKRSNGGAEKNSKRDREIGDHAGGDSDTAKAKERVLWFPSLVRS